MWTEYDAFGKFLRKKWQNWLIKMDEWNLVNTEESNKFISSSRHKILYPPNDLIFHDRNGRVLGSRITLDARGDSTMDRESRSRLGRAWRFYREAHPSVNSWIDGNYKRLIRKTEFLAIGSILISLSLIFFFFFNSDFKSVKDNLDRETLSIVHDAKGLNCESIMKLIYRYNWWTVQIT